MFCAVSSLKKGLTAKKSTTKKPSNKKKIPLLPSCLAFSLILEEDPRNMPLQWDNVVSLSVIGLYAVPVLLSLLTQNPYELFPFVGMVLTVGINETIKYVLIGERSPRPAGARDCNLWATDGPQSGRPGMPSGHAAHVSFFVGYYLQRLSSVPFPFPFPLSFPSSRFLLSLLLVLYALLVMLSRYTKCCHTVPQLLTGSALGLFLSVIATHCVPNRA